MADSEVAKASAQMRVLARESCELARENARLRIELDDVRRQLTRRMGEIGTARRVLEAADAMYGIYQRRQPDDG
jgi:regulator of replication initiation timing